MHNILHTARRRSVADVGLMAGSALQTFVDETCVRKEIDPTAWARDFMRAYAGERNPAFNRFVVM